MRGFGLQRQRPVADQLRIAAVLLRKIGRWMPQYACYDRSSNLMTEAVVAEGKSSAVFWFNHSISYFENI